MNSIMSFFIALCFFGLSACNLIAEPNTGPGTKTLQNTWASTNGVFTLNLSGANVGGSLFSAKYTFSDSSYCTCNLKITQTAGVSVNSSGSLNNTGCSLIIGVEATQICPTLVYSGTYNQTGSSLEICQSGTTTCQDYK